jgi:hypothetical protein
VQRLGLAWRSSRSPSRPASAAKSYQVNGREQKAIADGSLVEFHVTRIVVAGTSWSATFLDHERDGAA